MLQSIHIAIAVTSIAAAAVLCAPPIATAQPIIATKTLPIYKPPPPAATKPTPRVAALIRALSNESPVKRDGAQRSLLKMGPKIEPQLQSALNTYENAVTASDKQNPAIHQTYMRGFGLRRLSPDHVLPRYAGPNLSVLIDRLDERRHASPSLFTLQYADAPLQAILSDFGRQLDVNISVAVSSFYRVALESDLDWITTARISLHVDHADYWSALQTILHALPSLAPRDGEEQFLQVGFDRVYLTPVHNKWDDPTFSAQASTVSGPMQIAASITGSGATTLTLRAVAEPTLTGLNRNGMVRIDSVTDDLGRSLLPGDKRIFLSADENRQYVPSDGYRAWRVQIPLEPLEPGRRIATIRGQFGIGTAPPHQSIAIPLPTPQEPSPPPSSQEIVVAEDCRILNSSGGDDPPYRFSPDVCHRDRPHITRQDGTTIQEHTLLLTDVNPTPVTFVVFCWLLGGHVDSDPQPVQVTGDTAIFRVHANPGEVVHLHIGVRYDQPATPRIASAPTPAFAGDSSHSSNSGQPLNFDGWVTTVKSVIHTGSLYSVSGELSRPIDAPTGSGGIHLYLGLADRSRWTIVNKDRSVTQRQQGDRLIEDWTLYASEPGRIPATLLWDTPDATHWLTAPFELHNIAPTH